MFAVVSMGVQGTGEGGSGERLWDGEVGWGWRGWAG